MDESKIMTKKNNGINFREVNTMLEKYENSPRIRLLIWVVLGAVYLFGFAALINAVKWW